MTDADPTDEALMLRYRDDGDAGAFAILYERHRGGLYRFCLRMGRDAARAEEVFQDAWMNLINARERYRVEARFKTFLYQIAHNRMIDLLRRDGAGTVSLDDEAGEAIAASLAAPVREQPEAAVAMKRRLERVADAVERLPAAQREAFLLHEEGELTLEEIAELTGVGRETAKSRLRYALVRLRADLAGEAEP
ncbi:MAG: RNA polymerase sigma factor [Burkholderiales bacterium]|nr:RNA polymerase sigma factor [Burkholderiales bacterium]